MMVSVLLRAVLVAVCCVSLPRPGAAQAATSRWSPVTVGVEMGPTWSRGAEVRAPLLSLSPLIAFRAVTRESVAWVLAVQGSAVVAEGGDDLICYLDPRVPGECVGQAEFLPRLAALTGADLLVDHLGLRLLAGPLWFTQRDYRVGSDMGSFFIDPVRTTRPGAHLRVEMSYPARKPVAFTVAAARTFAGSQRGRNLSFGHLSVGLRFAADE
jgi:hypothetical protein